jgi:hypothetical protein
MEAKILTCLKEHLAVLNAQNQVLVLQYPVHIEKLRLELKQNPVLIAEQDADSQLGHKTLIVSGFSQPMEGLFSADVEHCKHVHRNEENFEIRNTYTKHNSDIIEALASTGEKSGRLYSNPDSYLQYLQQAFCAIGGMQISSHKACIRNLFQVWDANVVFASAYLEIYEDKNVFIGGGTASAVKFWQLYGKPGSKCYFYYDFSDGQFHQDLRTKIRKAKGKEAVAPHAWYEVGKDDCCGDIVLAQVRSDSLHGVMHRLTGKVVAGIGGVGLSEEAKNAIDVLYAK